MPGIQETYSAVEINQEVYEAIDLHEEIYEDSEVRISQFYLTILLCVPFKLILEAIP